VTQERSQVVPPRVDEYARRFPLLNEADKRTSGQPLRVISGVHKEKVGPKSRVA
jgi:hypothetical protein